MATTESREVDRLVDETRELIADVERGEFERAAWAAIADHLVAIKAETGWGHRRIADEVGQAKSWVTRVLQWRASGHAHGHASPFVRGTPGQRTEAERNEIATRKILREQPEVVADEIAAAVEALPPKEFEKVEQATIGRRMDDLDREQPGARERRDAWDDERKARKQIANALAALKARAFFYDQPLDEHERALIPACRKVLDVLEGKAEMDDELEDFLNEVLS